MSRCSEEHSDRLLRLPGHGHGGREDSGHTLHADFLLALVTQSSTYGRRTKNHPTLTLKYSLSFSGFSAILVLIFEVFPRFDFKQFGLESSGRLIGFIST